MRARLEQVRAKDSGFTLVELLIVITILGVLAAIVVFSIAAINNSSAASACQSDVSTTNSALEASYAQNGSYPASLDLLWTGIAGAPPLLKSEPTWGGVGTPTYDATKGTITIDCG